MIAGNKPPQILAGLPDTIDTYGIVSGLWTSVFALGAFVGERTCTAPHSKIPADPENFSEIQVKSIFCHLQVQ